MSDNIVITMPSTLHEFIMAIAVAQEFQMHLHLGAEKGTRDINYTVTFRLEEQFRYLQPCLQVLKNIVPTYDYSGWLEQSRGDYDCFIDFDFERAKKAAIGNKRHITEGFGVLIGTYTNAMLYSALPQRTPILGPLMLHKVKELEINVGVLKWDEVESNKFVSFISNNYPELNLSVIDTQRLDNAEILIKWVHNQDIVIGKHSCTTYVAASFNKPLIEIFDNDDDAVLYNNSTLPLYKALKSPTPAEYMWLMWEELWERLQEASYAISPQELVNTTEQDQSTAMPVEEKL